MDIFCGAIPSIRAVTSLRALLYVSSSVKLTPPEAVADGARLPARAVTMLGDTSVVIALFSLCLLLPAKALGGRPHSGRKLLSHGADGVARSELELCVARHGEVGGLAVFRHCCNLDTSTLRACNCLTKLDISSVPPRAGRGLAR